MTTIPLIEGAQPVNIRPYRHPPTRKDAIEGMVAELLKSGVIKKSNTLFSSPIIMRMSAPTQLIPKLMGFDYEIQYKKRVENVTADALSRIQYSSELFSMVSSSLTTNIYQRIMDSWQTNTTLKEIIKKLKQGQAVKGSYTWANQELRRKRKLVYNNNHYSSINTTPYEMVYGQTPPLPMPYVGGESKVEAVDRTLSAREEEIEVYKFHLRRAQDRMKSQADKKRTYREF
uniref:Retrotransposable element Tf2 n=1 Tax=Tanacetum cinerariifolium TaxID=118510 RepID=A0A699IXS5_TANCI|nr:retrotransposable element Tf2 [Tanacetum cinerariifolium]